MDKEGETCFYVPNGASIYPAPFYAAIYIPQWEKYVNYSGR